MKLCRRWYKNKEVLGTKKKKKVPIPHTMKCKVPQKRLSLIRFPMIFNLNQLISAMVGTTRPI